VSFSRSGLLVPNELLQQENGQRQDRNNKEVAGQFSYQHTVSSNVMATVQGRVRDAQAGLVSNALSTPIEVFQDRGFRESYVSGTVAAALKHHDLKAGVDTIYTLVHERFSYHITDPQGFDPSTPLDFAFHDSGYDREQAVFVQDNVHFGNFNISAGIRFDHYRVRVEESAWSPRVGFAWFVPKLGVVFRGSYDRVFGTPAIENLLLSTSAGGTHAGPESGSATAAAAVARKLPELGATKELFKRLTFQPMFSARHPQRL
jgi:outer membrane receptor for Fe3+-dicitrate